MPTRVRRARLLESQSRTGFTVRKRFPHVGGCQHHQLDFQLLHTHASLLDESILPYATNTLPASPHPCWFGRGQQEVSQAPLTL